MIPFYDYYKINILDGVHFRCDFQDLGHPWTDWDETLGVYRVDLEIMQRHIFDFRSEIKTGNGPSRYDIVIISVRKFTWRLRKRFPIE